MDWTLLYRRVVAAAALVVGTAGGVLAQGQTKTAPALGGPSARSPISGLLRTNVSVLEARGDSLFIGPCLNLTTGGSPSFEALATERLCSGSPNRLLSLDVEGDVLVGGLGRSAAGGVSAAAGFLLSRDGGETFEYRFPQTDVDSTAHTVQYGINVLPAELVVRGAESAPFSVDYVDSTDALWVAGRASGLRRSTDGGRTYERLVLPPDSLDAIVPFRPYRFSLRAKRGERGPGFFNHIVSSVLVDETGTVWAGTSAGVNRSRPEDVFVFERPDSSRFTERAWRRFGFDNTAAPGAPDSLGDGLSGNFVPHLSEQPLDGRRNPVWMVTRGTLLGGERPGVTVTRDGGKTFEQALVGERILDFAFRGQTVYAAGERGLFISDDGGKTWRLMRDFSPPDQPGRFVAPDPEAFAVATTPGALWVGTGAGLFKSTDGGRTWQVFRTQVPLAPEEPTEDVPEASTYAYPNPFSPVAAPSGVVRIVSSVEEAGPVEVNIYDFNMNLVRSMSETCPASGNCEIAWNGTDEDGLRVANGVYLYTVDTGDGQVRGKIMVLE